MASATALIPFAVAMVWALARLGFGNADVPVMRTMRLTAVFAGVAGGIISTFQPITPTAGDPYTLRAFVVVILGGLGRVSATVVGGLAFGLIEVLGQSAPGLGSGYADAIAFVVLVVVLVVRPRGLLGRLA